MFALLLLLLHLLRYFAAFAVVVWTSCLHWICMAWFHFLCKFQKLVNISSVSALPIDYWWQLQPELFADIPVKIPSYGANVFVYKNGARLVDTLKTTFYHDIWLRCFQKCILNYALDGFQCYSKGLSMSELNVFFVLTQKCASFSSIWKHFFYGNIYFSSEAYFIDLLPKGLFSKQLQLKSNNSS